MADPLFVKHPDFPHAKCSFTGSGYFWKMVVREWAFAKVNVNNLSGLDVESNSPLVR